MDFDLTNKQRREVVKSRNTHADEVDTVDISKCCESPTSWTSCQIFVFTLLFLIFGLGVALGILSIVQGASGLEIVFAWLGAVCLGLSLVYCCLAYSRSARRRKGVAKV